MHKTYWVGLYYRLRPSRETLRLTAVHWHLETFVAMINWLRTDELPCWYLDGGPASPIHVTTRVRRHHLRRQAIMASVTARTPGPVSMMGSAWLISGDWYCCSVSEWWRRWPCLSLSGFVLTAWRADVDTTNCNEASRQATGTTLEISLRRSSSPGHQVVQEHQMR